MSENSTDKLYQNPTLTEVYEATSGWADDCDFYLSLARGRKLDILDLGCGTGLLCDAYVDQGHNVVGVDPAREMLEVAKKKANGDLVTWIVSSGQDFSYDSKFDLIVMTGHAFQCLLSDADVSSLLRNVHQLLKQHGTFVFESRNPNVDWEPRWNGTVEKVDSPQGSFLMSTRVLNINAELMTFQHKYVFDQETLNSVSTIRFPTKSLIEQLIEKAGLIVVDTFGDWKPSPFDENLSKEMIFQIKRP